MKNIQHFAILATLLSPLAVAEPPPKTVVIGGQTRPIDIQIMPDVTVPVTLAPGTVVATQAVPVVPAKPTGFDINGGNLAGNQPEPLTVARDSVLKFVNLTFTNAFDTLDDGFIQCRAIFNVYLGGLQNPPVKLAHLQMQDRTGISRQGNDVAVYASGDQFLTGDLHVSAGSVLTLSVFGASGSCSASAYGILFEQE